MAKKVVISDLVVQVGIESKATERKLKDLDKEISRSSKKQTRESEKRAKAEAKAVMNAKAWMNTSREFYKLRKADSKTAKRIQDQLTKSYISGDRARQGALKSQISQRLDAFREEAAQETRKEGNYKKAMRARMLMRKRAYKDTARQNKLQEAERKREEGFRREQRRVMRTRVRRTAMSVGEGVSSVGKYALGAAGLSVAGAGFGAVAAGKEAFNKTVQMRTAEQSLRVGLQGRDKGDEFDAIRQDLTLRAAKLNSSATATMQEVGLLLASLRNQSVQTVSELTLGMSAWSRTFGLSATQTENAMVGMRQVGVGSYSAQNFRQITDNVTALVPVVAKVLRMTPSQYEAALSKGTIKNNVEAIGGGKAFIEELSREIYVQGVKSFNQTKGSLPFAVDRNATMIEHLQTSFGAGTEDGVIAFLTNLNTVMGKYQGDFREAGMFVGDFIQATGQVLQDDILPMIDGYNASLKDMPSKDRVAMFKKGIEEFGSTLKFLAEGFLVIKTLGIVVTIAEFATAISKLGAVGTGVEVALSPVIALLGGIAAAAYVATSSKFKKGGSYSAGGIFGDNDFTSFLDTPLSQLFSSTPTPTATPSNMVNGIPNSGANTTIDNSKHMYVQGNVDSKLHAELVTQGFSVDSSPYPTRE